VTAPASPPYLLLPPHLGGLGGTVGGRLNKGYYEGGREKERRLILDFPESNLVLLKLELDCMPNRTLPLETS
jgi:hypothetical protein